MLRILPLPGGKLLHGLAIKPGLNRFVWSFFQTNTFSNQVFQVKDAMGVFVTSTFIEKNCTRVQVESIIENFFSVRAMALICGMLQDLPKVSHIGINYYHYLVSFFDDYKSDERAQLLKDFDDVLEESKELQVVAQWLRIINVQIEVELPHDLETKTLNDLKIAVSEYQDGMGLREETLNVLRFFLARKSMLFEAIALKYIKDLQYTVSIQSKVRNKRTNTILASHCG